MQSQHVINTLNQINKPQCYHQLYFLEVVLSAFVLYRWWGLRPALLDWFTVSVSFVECTELDAIGSRRKQFVRAFIRACSDNDFHCWLVIRWCAYSDRSTNSPCPVSARSASTNWASTSVRSLSMRSGIRWGRHWIADFSTWLILSHPLLVQEKQPAAALSRNRWTNLANNQKSDTCKQRWCIQYQ